MARGKAGAAEALPAAPGLVLALALAVASVYRRITANGYSPYVMLGLAAAMGIASLNAILCSCTP